MEVSCFKISTSAESVHSHTHTQNQTCVGGCVSVCRTLALWKNCRKQPRGSCCEFAAISRMNCITTAWCATCSIRASFCTTHTNTHTRKYSKIKIFRAFSSSRYQSTVLQSKVPAGLVRKGEAPSQVFTPSCCSIVHQRIK